MGKTSSGNNVLQVGDGKVVIKEVEAREKEAVALPPV